MPKTDREYMEDAVALADKCKRIKDSIPRVGAIIVSNDGNVIGEGWRGDDDHAEHLAIHSALEKHPAKLAGATLFTTLEPCTPEVRTKGEECCIKLIEQHRISKVFVGILDPNQGVTGKGLLRLQELNVEFGVFPHDLRQRILSQNAAFFRSQETLGALILSPQEGEVIRIFESGGRFPIRFKANKAPSINTTYLLVFKDGMCWPQLHIFRQIDQWTWEIDANFGGIGNYDVHLVTANDLGQVLMGYYRKVISENEQRWQRLRGKISWGEIGGLYPPIEMNGLPKGLRPEASVTVTTSPKLVLNNVTVEPITIARGGTLTITYDIESFEDVPSGIWLGSSFNDTQTQRLVFNTSQDEAISVQTGRKDYHRRLTIPEHVSLGSQMLRAEAWYGAVGKPSQSKLATTRPPTEIKIVEK